MRVPLLLSIGSLLLLSHPAQSWWDTRLEVTRLILPADKEFSASQMGGSTIEQDLYADGGKGGKVHWLVKDGPALSQKVTLKPGIYSWSALCRMREFGFSTPLFGMTLSQDNKEIGKWFLPGRVSGFYGAISFYFPIETEGEYTISFHLEGNAERLMERRIKEQPGEPLVRFDENAYGLPAILQSIQNTPGVLVDRFELASLLPSDPLKQRKTKRNLSDDEVYHFLKIRKEMRGVPVGRVMVPDLEALWKTMPEYNVLTINGRDGYNYRDLRSATLYYLQTKDEAVGVYAAILLCGLSEKLAAADYNATYFGGEHILLSKDATAQWSSASANTVGKSLYRGWAHQATEEVLVAYDVLFDVISSNKDFLEKIQKFIPALKTNDDVIAFLDTRLLWSSARDIQRCWIGKDTTASLIAQIFGAGPVADEVLRNTLFDRIQANMVHLGSIDDNAVTTFDRDGIRYVGSSLYSDGTLIDIAESLKGYRELGGAENFDFLSFPEARAAQLNRYSLSAMRMGNGFRMTTGDGGGLNQVSEPGFDKLPSRVLGGSGYTVLESGQFDADPLKNRAVGIYWGSGRGHAHSDTLNAELFAHSSRMAPDLGGREEGKDFGRPNMRTNRVHNLVEIDDKDFWNPSLSITSATGWLVSFAPAPNGSQFTEHRALALSHPNVSLYQRQTALISVPGEKREESYLFDVFRIRGGKTHSYNFHGGVTDSLKLNSDLTSAEEHPVLKDHRKGSRQKGVAAAVVEAEWPLSEAMQKRYQEKHYEEGRQPVTRLMLFGQEGASVLVGNAYSESYQYDFPLLYVRKEGKTEAEESCFPALIELYAGKPFLKSAKLLTPVTNDAQAPVALQVDTVSGRQDLLYSSGKPESISRIDKQAEVVGRFAFVARKGSQLEEARLVGGTRLSTPEISISIPEARIIRKIESVDCASRKLKLNESLPDSFEGAAVTIHNGNRFHAFNLEGVNGKDVTLKEYPGFYKSNLLRVSEDGKTVVGELEAEQSRWDAGFARNTVLTNEDFSRSVRVEAFEDDEQWMTLGYPGYRWSFPISATENDFPDVDGDGKRMARLEVDPHYPDILPAAPGEIEVIRIDKDRIYFRVPENGSEHSRLKEGGWNLNGFILVPEGGGKRFYSRYAGKHMRWRLQSPLTQADMADANGDGKTKLHAFLFASGDTLDADAAIQIIRNESGEGYRIRSNTPAIIGFPKGGFKPSLAQYKEQNVSVELQSKEGYLLLELTPEMVSAGEILLTER